MREIRDPIHGFISRTQTEEAIIDTAVFQRLRRIKQLALASLVYPGAVHTRFDHSIGVMHLTHRLIDRLLRNYDPEDRQLVCYAALLHDLGHGPFSHVSENVLEKFYDKKLLGSHPKAKLHEVLTCKAIKSDPQLGRLLSAEQLERIEGLLSGTWGDPLYKAMLSGPLDADKQDYLLRDSYFCGVKYGIYDIERLLGTLEIINGAGDGSLAISVDGIHTLEQFVLAKYYMTTQVYMHKIRLVTDAMITRALELAVTGDEIEYVKRLYRFDGTEEHLQFWLDSDDQQLTQAILQSKYGYGKEIFCRLLKRRLHKRVFQTKLLTFEPELREQLSQNSQDYKQVIEQKVGSLLDVDPCLVIANKFKIKSVRRQSEDEDYVGAVMVARRPPAPFEEESVLFRSITKAEEDEFLEVYAPVKFEGPADKREKLAHWGETITNDISMLAKSKLEGGAALETG